MRCSVYETVVLRQSSFVWVSTKYFYLSKILYICVLRLCSVLWIASLCLIYMQDITNERIACSAKIKSFFTFNILLICSFSKARIYVHCHIQYFINMITWAVFHRKNVQLVDTFFYYHMPKYSKMVMYKPYSSITIIYVINGNTFSLSSVC